MWTGGGDGPLAQASASASAPAPAPAAGAAAWSGLELEAGGSTSSHRQIAPSSAAPRIVLGKWEIHHHVKRKQASASHVRAMNAMHEQIVRVVRTYLPSNDTAVCLIGDLHSWLHSLKMHKCLHPAEASELLASQPCRNRCEEEKNWKFTGQLRRAGWTALPRHRSRLYCCLSLSSSSRWLLFRTVLWESCSLESNPRYSHIYRYWAIYFPSMYKI